MQKNQYIWFNLEQLVKVKVWQQAPLSPGWWHSTSATQSVLYRPPYFVSCLRLIRQQRHLQVILRHCSSASRVATKELKSKILLAHGLSLRSPCGLYFNWSRHVTWSQISGCRLEVFSALRVCPMSRTPPREEKPQTWISWRIGMYRRWAAQSQSTLQEQLAALCDEQSDLRRLQLSGGLISPPLIIFLAWSYCLFTVDGICAHFSLIT